MNEKYKVYTNISNKILSHKRHQNSFLWLSYMKLFSNFLMRCEQTSTKEMIHQMSLTARHWLPGKRSAYPWMSAQALTLDRMGFESLKPRHFGLWRVLQMAGITGSLRRFCKHEEHTIVYEQQRESSTPSSMLHVRLFLSTLENGSLLSQPLQYIELHRDSAGASASRTGTGRLCASRRKIN